MIMKIPNLLDRINKDEFKVSESRIADTDVILIQPEVDAKWNKDNLIFRSSLWTKEGELISAGFPKFFNYGEQLELSPPPTDISDAVLPAKIDGSLLILTKYKGEIIMRTRGTFDARIHDNGGELAILKEKYPMLFYNWYDDTWAYSILIEWVSPTNQIILKYPEVDFYLIGIVNHDDYSLMKQENLDLVAKCIGMKRPEIYKFKTLEDLMTTIKESKGIEGLVMYTNGEQTLHKVKSAWYLALHRMKSLIGSFDKIYDVWVSFGRPLKYADFYYQMEKTFDFEIAEQCKDTMQSIVDIGEKVKIILDKCSTAIEEIKKMSTRKEQAFTIQKDYKDYQSCMFLLLNGKLVDDKTYRNIFFQTKDFNG